MVRPRRPRPVLASAVPADRPRGGLGRLHRRRRAAARAGRRLHHPDGALRRALRRVGVVAAAEVADGRHPGGARRHVRLAAVVVRSRPHAAARRTDRSAATQGRAHRLQRRAERHVLLRSHRLGAGRLPQRPTQRARGGPARARARRAGRRAAAGRAGRAGPDRTRPARRRRAPRQRHRRAGRRRQPPARGPARARPRGARGDRDVVAPGRRPDAPDRRAAALRRRRRAVGPRPPARPRRRPPARRDHRPPVRRGALRGGDVPRAGHGRAVALPGRAGGAQQRAPSLRGDVGAGDLAPPQRAGGARRGRGGGARRRPHPLHAREDGGGFGLDGIRERVAMHGGLADIGPRPAGGFRVRVRIPVDREDA